MLTKRKIKNLVSNRNKMNKSQIIDRILFYTDQHNKGVTPARFVVMTYFTVLGLTEKEANQALQKIQEPEKKPETK